MRSSPGTAGHFPAALKRGYPGISQKQVLPANVNLFDFALGDLNNDGANEIIALSQHDRLQVYDATAAACGKAANITAAPRAT